MNHWLDPDTYPMIDWQDRLITENGFTHSHAVTMTASSDKVKTMASFSYFDQNAIIKYTDFQRYNFRNNMDVKLHEKLTLRMDISVSYGMKSSLSSQGNVFTFANARDPLMRAEWSDGSYAPFTGGTLNILPVIEKVPAEMSRKETSSSTALWPLHISRWTGLLSKESSLLVSSGTPTIPLRIS